MLTRSMPKRHGLKKGKCLKAQSGITHVKRDVQPESAETALSSVNMTVRHVIGDDTQPYTRVHVTGQLKYRRVPIKWDVPFIGNPEKSKKSRYWGFFIIMTGVL